MFNLRVTPNWVVLPLNCILVNFWVHLYCFHRLALDAVQCLRLRRAHEMPIASLHPVFGFKGLNQQRHFALFSIESAMVENLTVTQPFGPGRMGLGGPGFKFLGHVFESVTCQWMAAAGVQLTVES